MSEADKYIAKAAAMPLRDAAFALWCWRSMLDNMEESYLIDVRHPKFAGMSADAVMPIVERERAAAVRQIMTERLKRAHPRAADADIGRAIDAAMKFNDDCFRHFSWNNEDFWTCVVRAVASAVRDNPGYRDDTHRTAENHVAYYMK